MKRDARQKRKKRTAFLSGISLHFRLFVVRYSFSKNVKQLQLKSLKLFFQACSISNNMKKISVFNFFYLHNTGLEAVILFILMDMGLFFRD